MRVRYLGPYDTLILPKHSRRGDLVIRYGEVVTLAEDRVLELMRTGRRFEEVADPDASGTPIDVPDEQDEEGSEPTT